MAPQKKARSPRRRVRKNATSLSDRFSAMGPMSQAPAAMSNSIRNIPPGFQGSGDRMRIRHSELVTLLSGSSNFQVGLYPLNPGVPVLFPWLAQIAGRFDQYRFNMLRFTYTSRIGSTAVGDVMLAIDYDASDPAPTTDAQLSTYHTYHDDVPWKPQMIVASVPDLNAIPKHYVRLGLVPSTDIKTYDSGNFILATQGTAGSLGKVYVEYDVELFSPILSPGLGGFIVPGGSIDPTDPFGSAPAVTGVLPCEVSSNTLTFVQQFEGLIQYDLVGPTAVPLGGSCTFSELSFEQTVAGGASGLIAVSASPGQTLQFTTVGTVTSGEFCITPGPFSVFSLVP